jgi:glucuronosyltransferase
MEEEVRKKFKFNFPPLSELEKKTALMMVNTHNAIDFPEPLQPNVIQVGGLQISEPKKLPEVRLKFKVQFKVKTDSNSSFRTC